MKKLRKVDKGKRKKQRKDAQKKMEEQVSLLSNHPKECCVCKKLFTRNHDTVKNWMVTIVSEKKKVHLTCPDCWDTVKEIAKCQE